MCSNRVLEIMSGGLKVHVGILHYLKMYYLDRVSDIVVFGKVCKNKLKEGIVRPLQMQSCCHLLHWATMWAIEHSRCACG